MTDQGSETEPELVVTEQSEAVQEGLENVTIPLEWHVSDQIVSRYANHLVIQRSEQNFYLSFFEAVPPLIIGGPAETLAQLRELGAVRSECVARLVVSADRLPALITILQDAARR